MEQYYYNRMNKIEQAVYHALYQGFLNIDEEIQIPRLEGEALYNVFFKLRLDHPEIFWATGYKYKYYNETGKQNSTQHIGKEQSRKSRTDGFQV